MLNFEWNLPTQVVFGKEQEKAVGVKIKEYGGSKVLLHHYGDVFSEKLISDIKTSIEEAGLSWVELTGVKPNPRVSLVYKGIKMCKEQGVDFILAIGGGSAIDSSKAIGMGACTEKDVWDFYLLKDSPKDALPVGVVLTIAAAGSECSNGSVVTNEEGWKKRTVTAPCIRPKFAIMNPEVTYTVPKYLSNCGSVDIMAHAMERYFTNERNVETTDRIIEGLLKTVINNAPIISNDPTNYGARAEIMWTGNLTHNEICGTGRMGDYASHYLGHELSAMYDIAHGATLAIVFPAWMKYVYKHDVKRFVQFASRVWNIDIDHYDLEATALKGIEAYTSFVKSLDVPVTMKEAGCKREDIPELAKKCTELMDTVGEFVKLDYDDIVKIYEIAFE